MSNVSTDHLTAGNGWRLVYCSANHQPIRTPKHHTLYDRVQAYLWCPRATIDNRSFRRNRLFCVRKRKRSADRRKNAIWLCSEIFPPITSPSPSPSQYFGPPAEMWLCRAGNPPDTCGQPPLANKIN